MGHISGVLSEGGEVILTMQVVGTGGNLCCGGMVACPWSFCIHAPLPSPWVRVLDHVSEVSSEGGVSVLTLALVEMGSVWHPGDVVLWWVP